MSKTIGAGFLILLAIALFVLYSAAFTVSESYQALVLRFGEPREVVQDAGLHWKVPVADNVYYLDDRILDLDSPVQEVIASDQKRLVVDAFARYRIADPLRFYQSVGTIDQAESRLATVLNSALRRVLGEQTFFAVVRDERDDLMREITQQVNREAQSFGIDVVDVRIRRADLPQANSEAIYRRMQTEREQEAAQIRAEGEEQARRIRSRADREATILVAEAERDAQEIRGEGDARRNSIFAEAYSQDPTFFDFYRSMQAYERGLPGESTRFVVTPDSDFFRYFINSNGQSAATTEPPAGLFDGDAPVEESEGAGDAGASLAPVDQGTTGTAGTVTGTPGTAGTATGTDGAVVGAAPTGSGLVSAPPDGGPAEAEEEPAAVAPVQ